MRKHFNGHHLASRSSLLLLGLLLICSVSLGLPVRASAAPLTYAAQAAAHHPADQPCNYEACDGFAPPPYSNCYNWHPVSDTNIPDQYNNAVLGDIELWVSDSQSNACFSLWGGLKSYNSNLEILGYTVYENGSGCDGSRGSQYGRVPYYVPAGQWFSTDMVGESDFLGQICYYHAAIVYYDQFHNKKLVVNTPISLA